MGENQIYGREEEEERCSPSRAACAPVPSHAPRVMGGSSTTLMAVYFV